MAAPRMQEAICRWTDSRRKWPSAALVPQIARIRGFLKPVGCLIALELMLLALFNGLPFALGNNASLALSLAGSSAVHLSSRPSMKDILTTAFMAGALRTLYVWSVGPIGHYFGSAWISWGSFLGLASLITLGVRAVTARDTRRRSASRDFWGASVFLYSWFVVIFAMEFTPLTVHDTMDRFLYAFDGSLGFEPSFAAGRILAWLPTSLKNVTYLQYEALMLALAIVYSWQRMRTTIRTPKILPVSLSMMVSGYVLYHLYPAAGPLYGFGRLFPQHPPDVLRLALVPIPLASVARNAMPSLHMGTALLVWWHSRGSHWVGRVLAGLFLLATGFSTMAIGEHYLIDLVVAFPFALAIQAAWATALPLAARERYLPLVTGTLITFAWLALLRFGIHWLYVLPVLPWLLLAFTVVYSSLTEMKLIAACHRMPQAGSLGAPPDLPESQAVAFRAL